MRVGFEKRSDNFFEQISELALGCKFGDCTHTTEPGCKILAALRSGELDEKQYNNYTSLKKETEFYEMTEVEKREKDRQFGKFIKKVKKDLSDYGHKNFG